LELKPANVTFEQASSVPTSGLVALLNLCVLGRLRTGQKVLINGAAGCVGTIAVQVAKSYGAEVTAVDCAAKLDLLRTLGADRVIDYAREDFTRGSERYDLILDIPGNHSLSECRRALTPGGVWVLVAHDQYGKSGDRWLGPVGRALGLMALSPFVSQLPRMRDGMGKPPPLSVLKELMEAGKLTPVIDKVFPLAEVPRALRYLAEGQPLGRVIITM
jgi:NADPH:quinone reductase-like Zn-dependent oxidoreductase